MFQWQWETGVTWPNFSLLFCASILLYMYLLAYTWLSHCLFTGCLPTCFSLNHATVTSILPISVSLVACPEPFNGTSASPTRPRNMRPTTDSCALRICSGILLFLPLQAILPRIFNPLVIPDSKSQFHLKSLLKSRGTNLGLWLLTLSQT